MQRTIVNGVLVAALLFGFAGCTAMTGKTAGTNIDDATITASVKTNLATDRVGTLTAVDVDTVRGTVYLSGTVPDQAAKDRAAELARDVDGVQRVENNLQVMSRAGDAPRDTGSDITDDEIEQDY